MEEEGPLANELPELVQHMLEFLDPGSLLGASQVCKRFHALARNAGRKVFDQQVLAPLRDLINEKIVFVPPWIGLPRTIAGEGWSPTESNGHHTRDISDARLYLSRMRQRLETWTTKLNESSAGPLHVIAAWGHDMANRFAERVAMCYLNDANVSDFREMTLSMATRPSHEASTVLFSLQATMNKNGLTSRLSARLNSALLLGPAFTAATTRVRESVEALRVAVHEKNEQCRRFPGDSIIPAIRQADARARDAANDNIVAAAGAAFYQFVLAYPMAHVQCRVRYSANWVTVKRDDAWYVVNNDFSPLFSRSTNTPAPAGIEPPYFATTALGGRSRRLIVPETCMPMTDDRLA